MSTRLWYLVGGALALASLELLVEALHLIQTPAWFQPVWLTLTLVVQLVAFPAHLAAAGFMLLLPADLQPPPMPKPFLTELGWVTMAATLCADAVEGALLGWLVYDQSGAGRPASSGK